jgi:hypothetical protein
MKAVWILIIKSTIFLFSAYLLINDVKAQTNPAAQALPYSQNFCTTTWTSLPVGCAGWTLTAAPFTSQSAAEGSSASYNVSISSNRLFVKFIFFFEYQNFIVPTSIKYPEMVAEIFPHFESDTIPPFGQNTLWFL